MVSVCVEYGNYGGEFWGWGGGGREGWGCAYYVGTIDKGEEDHMNMNQSFPFIL